MPDVIALGAVNQDFVLRVPRRAEPGETVVTTQMRVFDGGKAANQAAAAARLGASTALIARVGDDPAGQRQREALQRHGVDTSWVLTDPDHPTGLAFITLTDDGENSITVGLGANAAVPAEQVTRAWAALGAPLVAIAQTEIGAGPVDTLADLARRSGTRLILNTAPVHQLAGGTLAAADPLVVNEHEAAQLLEQHEAAAAPSGQALARRLIEVTRARSVIVTLGATGAVVADARESWHLRPPTVKVVDTTGAGDAFIGALAAGLARGQSLDSAARSATAAGALAVSWPGARGEFT